MSLIVTSFLLLSSLAQAQPDSPSDIACHYVNQTGKPEKFWVQTIGKEDEILRLKFLGPVPDQYFAFTSRSKDETTKEYKSFASRQNAKSPLTLKGSAGSTFTVKMLKGGYKYRWQPGQNESYDLECSDQALIKSGPKNES